MEDDLQEKLFKIQVEIATSTCEAVKRLLDEVNQDRKKCFQNDLSSIRFE